MLYVSLSHNVDLPYGLNDLRFNISIGEAFFHAIVKTNISLTWTYL